MNLDGVRLLGDGDDLGPLVVVHVRNVHVVRHLQGGYDLHGPARALAPVDVQVRQRRAHHDGHFALELAGGHGPRKRHLSYDLASRKLSVLVTISDVNYFYGLAQTPTKLFPGVSTGSRNSRRRFTWQ